MSKELQIRNSTVDFLVFTRDAGEDGIEVRVQNGDVWLTQKAISQLFDVDRSVITKHLSNIFKEGELDENSVCAKFAQTADDGKTYNYKFYSLAAIIAVGYRINSERAMQFRTWAMELKTVPWMQLQSIILKLMGVAIILTSCGFYLAGSMTLQNCIGMIICSFLVFESLGSAGNYSTLLRIVDLSVSKVENVMRIKEMDTDGKNIIPKNFDIEVENVDFYYDENHAEDAKIINHLSVHIPERTTTAIVGPSGGGKTTLCHLISRFWDVSNGNISLGGENVRNYSVDSLMKNFSFVFQNVYLFEDTIANNIRFGQPEASMKLVMDAAKKACCHDFIMELPNGYDTVIGEGGTSLSGGEKQRISIARAIMKDAPVIILDEATANVDPENEKELMSAIEALTKEKTIIMIAHRLKTVEHADQILVLDKGQIVQQGRHSELLKQTGIYRKFILEREEAVGWKI